MQSPARGEERVILEPGEVVGRPTTNERAGMWCACAFLVGVAGAGAHMLLTSPAFRGSGPCPNAAVWLGAVVLVAAPLALCLLAIVFGWPGQRLATVTEDGFTYKQRRRPPQHIQWAGIARLECSQGGFRRMRRLAVWLADGGPDGRPVRIPMTTGNAWQDGKWLALRDTIVEKCGFALTTETREGTFSGDTVQVDVYQRP